MPIFDDERKKRLSEAFNEKLKQDAIEKLRFEREGINTPPETIVQPEAKPEAMPEVFYGGRTEPPTKTEARFIDMLRNVPSNTGVASIYQRSPYELSNMSTLQKAREGDLKSQLEMYYSPPTGTTRMSEFQRAKVEGKEKATLAQLLGEQARERTAIGSAGIAAESAEKRQAMTGLAGTEAAETRAEATLQAAEMKAEASQRAAEMLNAYRMATLELKEKLGESTLALKEKAIQLSKDKKDQLTMTDVKTGHNMALQEIKNRIMIDAMPNDQSMLANQPPENLLSLMMGGRIQSLPPDKKEQYIKEIRDVSTFYGTLEQQVLGRKGAKLPMKREETKRPLPVF